MADSNITKKALAKAFKELMAEVSFDKINVAHICQRCDMNRKSFYYHFKDKYDLVNWIFDTEFIAVSSKNTIMDGWEFITALCDYLYENRTFYRKALKIEGQNSFSDHFQEMLSSVVGLHIKEILEGEDAQDFHVHFFTDGIVAAIKRWILDKNSIPAEEFVQLSKSCIQRAAIKVYHEMCLPDNEDMVR